MRAWLVVSALILGLIGVWGEQGRMAPKPTRGGGTVSALEGPNPIPTPKNP
jgi:hypothetical protein